MWYHAHKLQDQGFDTSIWAYASRKKTIQKHGEDLVAFLKKEMDENPGRPLYFVTHSMGGLVLRAAVNHPECPIPIHSSRAVLLAPPNKGSMKGIELGKWKIVSWFCQEHSGKELLTQTNFDYLGDFPSSMPVKVITGTHDGLTTIKETSLPTPHEHEEIAEGHISILFSKKAHAIISEFFRRL